MPTITRQPGFTIIELLVVMAIMGALLALTVAGVNGLRQTQDVVAESQNILAKLDEARDDSVDARVGTISNNSVYGYIFSTLTQGNDHLYCVDQWYSTLPNTDPTLPGFQFPGTLSQNISAGTAGFVPPVDCPTQTSSSDGFTLYDTGIFDNLYLTRPTGITFQYDLNGSADPTINYIVFENITGDIYFFDKQGVYLTNTANQDVSLIITDNNGNKKTIFLQTQNTNEPPYVQ